MSLLDGLLARLRFFGRRTATDRELADELEFHHERDVERAMAAGLDRASAERAARLRFGGRVRHVEASRDEWAGPFAGIGQDLRIGLRRLRAQPGFTAVALLTLALGIGANTAIFSMVRGVLLEPLPWPEPERLVMIWQSDRDEQTWVSFREIVEFSRVSSFEQLGGFARITASLVDGEAERVHGAAATTDALEVLGARTVMGRLFTAEEDAPGRDDVVVLGHELWQRRFGGSPDVLGTRIRVTGVPRTVVGVLAPGFRMPLDFRHDTPTELVVPLAIDRGANLSWGDRGNFIVARLRPGVTPEQATADMHAAFARWLAAGLFEDADGRDTRRAFPLDDLLLGHVRPMLLLLFGAVGVILLIACANVAHLLLARADARRRDVAMRVALGASRLRIVRALLVETGVLATLGAALGVALAYGGLRVALATTPVHVLRMRGVELDWTVLGFTGLLALATTVLAGLAPAMHLGQTALPSLVSSARGESAPMRRGVRRMLIALETALSLVLVIGAALIARSFVELRRIDLGFDPTGVLTARVALPPADYPDAARVETFYRTLLERLRAEPVVGSAAAARVLPLGSQIGDWTITIEGRAPLPGQYPNGDWQIVTPGYVETMQIRVVEGRAITDADGPGAPPVAMLSESMAQRYWPGESAIGKRFHLGTADQPWITVVGIVADVRHNTVTETPRTEMYVPHAQWPVARGDGAPQRAMSIVVGARGDPLALAPLVRETVRALDASLPVSEVRTMQDIVDTALAGPRFTAMLLGVFAALALMLAAIGLYGVISFAVSRRSHELGIRLALGARRSGVVRLVMGEGLVALAIGVAAGLVASAWLSGLLEGQLYEVTPLDPGVFGGVTIVLLGVAAVAAYLPARRAAMIDPIESLRAD